MDRPQEEMQEVGFFGIYKETVKTILSRKKIFTQITLAFIFPLALLYCAYDFIADTSDSKIENDEKLLHELLQDLKEILSFENIGSWIFSLVYYSLLLLLSLFATASVVYTIAATYSGHEVTFKKVLKIVPKVWKRLALTFLWTYFAFFIYHLVTAFVLGIQSAFPIDTTFAILLLFILLVTYLGGFIYLTAIWQLASVVTVLESSYGLSAMTKANALIKGKRWLSWFVFCWLCCLFLGIAIVYYLSNFFGDYGVIFVLVSIFLLMNLFLLGYVAQTILYLVCKSYHQEPIDKLVLSTQLGGYLGEFEPDNKDIERGQPQHQV